MNIIERTKDIQQKIDIEELQKIHDELNRSFGPKLDEAFDSISGNYTNMGRTGIISVDITQNFEDLSGLIKKVKEVRAAALQEFNTKFDNYITAERENVANITNATGNSAGISV